VAEEPTGAPAGWPLGAEDEDRCDLCGEVVAWGEAPTYGCLGRPESQGRPDSGAPLGWVRHYDCHVRCFGRPRTGAEIRADMEANMARLRQAVARATEALGRVRGVVEAQEAPAGKPDAPGGGSYVAQGACGRCGRYVFQHPLADCPRWEPPREQWGG